MAGQKSFQSIEAEGTIDCPECRSDNIVKKSDEIYCAKCGFVIG